MHKMLSELVWTFRDLQGNGSTKNFGVPPLLNQYPWTSFYSIRKTALFSIQHTTYYNNFSP